MKKRVITAIMLATVALCGCTKQSNTQEVTDLNPVPIVEDNSTVEEENIKISDEDALLAIKNYCVLNNPSLEEMLGSEDYTVYFEVVSSEENEIVVMYRSYTGAIIRYYIDRTTGETYVTEFVSGITDGEERTEESFNIRDYVKAEE